MPKRYYLPAGLAFVFVLIGLATLNGDFLALALPLLFYLGLGVIYKPQALDLRVERSIVPQRASANEPITINVEVTNLGSHQEELLIEDQLPQHLELLQGATCRLTELASLASVELSYTVSGRRGRYQFSDVRVTARDRLGLSTQQQSFAAPAQVFILPSSPRLRRVAIRPRQTRVYSGNVPARLGGAGVEFFGVRQYMHGDALRRINWRISARHSDLLFSNDFEQERVSDAWLILDARLCSNIEKPGESLFEHSVTVVAALAQALLNEGNRVGLLVYGGFLDWTFPGYGKLQQERILRALARASPGESMIFDRLENLPARVFPSHSPLLFVSPLQVEDLTILVRLRARGYQVIVLSPDLVAFETGALSAARSQQLGLRFAQLERDLLLAQLRQAGIQVFNWDVATPFDQAMRLSLDRALLRMGVLETLR